MFNISLQNVKVEELVREITNNEQAVIGGEFKVTTQSPKDEYPSIYYVKVGDMDVFLPLSNKIGSSDVFTMTGYGYNKKYESKNSVYIEGHDKAGEPTVCYSTNLVITKFVVKNK